LKFSRRPRARLPDLPSTFRACAKIQKRTELDERHPYLFDVDREFRRQACVGQRTSVVRRLILFLACSHDDAVLHHYKRRMSSRLARSRSWVSLDG